MLAIDNEFQPTTSSDSTLPISEGVVLGFCVLRAVEQHVWAGGQCAGKVRCHALKHKQPTTPPKQNTPNFYPLLSSHLQMFSNLRPISISSTKCRDSIVRTSCAATARTQHEGCVGFLDCFYCHSFCSSAHSPIPEPSPSFNEFVLSEEK